MTRDQERQKQRCAMMAPSHSSGRAILPLSSKVSRSEAVLLSIFGDESADEKKTRVFAVAGVIGREDMWQRAEREWLQRTGREPFHATDCRDPKLYEDLAWIIAENGLGAHGVAVDLISFREFFPNTLPDIGYYLCFASVVGWCVSNVAVPYHEEIEFTFDHRKESEYDAGQLYNLFVNSPESEDDGGIFMQTKISFDSAKHNPRIQMADLVAHQTMRSLDYQIKSTKNEWHELLINILCRKGKTSIDLFREEYWAGFRLWADRLEDNHGLTNSYSTWLKKFRLTDNWSNRIKYVSDPKRLPSL